MGDDLPVGSRRYLTGAEIRVLREMGRSGDTIPVVAARMGLSTQTVKNHLTSSYRVLGVRSLTSAFIELGWLRVK